MRWSPIKFKGSLINLGVGKLFRGRLHSMIAHWFCINLWRQHQPMLLSLILMGDDLVSWGKALPCQRHWRGATFPTLSHRGGAFGSRHAAWERAPHKTRSVTPRPLRRAQGNFVCDTRALFWFVILWIFFIRGQIVIFCEISDQWIQPDKNGFGGIMWKPVRKKTKEKISREKSVVLTILSTVESESGKCSQQQVERSRCLVKTCKRPPAKTWAEEGKLRQGPREGEGKGKGKLKPRKSRWS